MDIFNIILIMVVVAVLIIITHHEWYRIRPFKGVGDMEAIDPSPGLPQLAYLDRIWEIVYVRLYSDPNRFDLLLRRGNEEERIVSFNAPEEISYDLTNILSIIAARGPILLRVLDRKVMDTDEGRERYLWNWNSLLDRTKEQKRQIDSLQHSLAVMEVRFDDMVEKEIDRVVKQTAKASGQASGKE